MQHGKKLKENLCQTLVFSAIFSISKHRSDFHFDSFVEFVPFTFLISSEATKVFLILDSMSPFDVQHDQFPTSEIDTPCVGTDSARAVVMLIPSSRNQTLRRCPGDIFVLHRCRPLPPPTTSGPRPPRVTPPSVEADSARAGRCPSRRPKTDRSNENLNR